MPQMETRTIQQPMTVHEATSDDEKPIIEGYALKFNKQSSVLGTKDLRFRETIDPHALDHADLSNVVALFNHDPNQVLGRTGVNLELNIDEQGLRYKLTPPDTQLGHDLLENIRSGVISQSSFAFSMPADSSAQTWSKSTERDAKYNRIIRSIDHVFDVSPVTTPAYPDTEVKVGQRSLDAISELDKPAEWVEQRSKLLVEINKEALLEDI